jgi:pyruvate formate lyase activating enzyme
VLRTVEKAVENCHVEITCLLIPSLNDSPEEQQKLAAWLGNLSADLVLHYSRYFPNYRMGLAPTPVSTMERTLEIARKYLNYVYPGNIDLPGGADTICPNCSNLIVSRSGYRTRIVGLDGNRCNNCNSEISIVVS